MTEGSASCSLKENRNLLSELGVAQVGVAKRGTAPVGVVAKQPGGKKRPLEEGNNGRHHHAYKPRKRRKDPGGPPGAPAPPQSALAQLNEARPGLQYRVLSRRGPVHAPVFVMEVEVSGQVFQGVGSTKQKAKLDAAQRALRSVVSVVSVPAALPPASGGHRGPVASTPSLSAELPADFTSDQLAAFGDHALFRGFDGPPGPLGPEGPVGPEGPLASAAPKAIAQCYDAQVPLARPPASLDSSPSSRNPVAVLNELRPGLRYRLVSERSDGHAKSFVMALAADDGTGRSFQGSAHNKRRAKARAAQAALCALYGLRPDRQPSTQAMPSGGLQLYLPQVLADAVSRLVVDKFSELTDNFSSPHARRKVLAGVVMTTGADVTEARVVCVTTGSKCISGEYLSDRGLALNDCHAEIIARRSLVRYLYSQLECFLSTDSLSQRSSVFRRRDDSLGFTLKDDVQFHLYVSTSPCGDARIFSPHETHMEGHPDRKARGRLRTKMESGEGTIPVRCGDALQTWGGDRLLTMSCSDKMARWNVVGFQGALLSHFTEPLYFSSVILGSLYHSEHLSRALYQRICCPLEGLPHAYTLHRPLLSGISNMEARQPGKAPGFSVNWTLGDHSLEVIDAATGKDDLGQPSRLCKHALYRRWTRLHCKLSSTLRVQTPATPPAATYRDAKQAVRQYHAAKRVLIHAFHQAGLGAWVRKPLELDAFC